MDHNLSKEMISKYGENSQLDIVVEELSELTKEVIKYKRTSTHGEPFDISHLAEELADTIVVSEIVFSILEKYGIYREQIMDIVKEKQTRTRKRYL